ncbi:MAG TPA: redoxin domain-containing protein [Candidatus Limnocylindrales bacterium]|nr:redoxin domain-containing protein [Candidatus Limnocylindrales bacterium]
MKTGVAILAGLLAGVLVAAGVLAAFVFVGPDPVGLRPTPSPTASVAPSPSASAGPSASIGPSASAPSPSGSGGVQTGFHVGETAPPLVVPQVGGGTIDLAALRGSAVWVNFMQTSCPECIDEFPRMNSFKARYGDKGLVIVAVDVREDEGTVATFANRLGATFPMGLDTDGHAQQAWGFLAMPVHFWIDREGIVRAGALGGIGPDVMAESLRTILPGVTITP